MGCLLLAILALATPVHAAAQAPTAPAAPYVATGEWAGAALRRLDVLGLLPSGHDPSFRSIARTEVVGLLEAAMQAAERDHPELLPLVRGLADRFRAEYPMAALRIGGRVSGIRLGSARVGAGYRRSSGGVLTALGAPDLPHAPPERLTDAGAAIGIVEASGYAGPALAGHGRLTAGAGEGVRVHELYGVAELPVFRVWAGRRAAGLGLAERSLILSGGVPMDGLGAEVRAFRLPGVLEHLGTLRASTGLGRVGHVEPFDAPWLWTLRASAKLHERFTIGLNRAAMVAPPDEEDASWLKQVTFVLIGKHSDELNRHDNQIASIDLVFRPPLGTLPLLTYVEWGFEDSAGAWRDVPGIVAGAYLGAVPGVPWLAAGAEHASFAESCCGNPWWYRHRGFAGGWTSDRQPLGHPLGGDGEEMRATVDAALAGARVLLRGDAYHRERRGENLYAPTFQGRSVGGELRLSALPRPDLRLELSVELEDGRGWTRRTLLVEAGFLF